LLPQINVHTLESIYEIVCTCKIIHGAEVWGLNEALRQPDKGYDNISTEKKIGQPSCATNVYAEMKGDRRRKVRLWN
jgi:hypothetical protein